MLDPVADGVAKDVQDDLSNDEEEDAENNVAQWPAVLERADDENNLADKVDEKENGVDYVRDNEDADRVLGIQTSPVLEGEEGDGATNNEHAQGGQSQQPDRQGRSVLIQLEANESIDQQAGAEGGDETVLGGSEVWVCGRARSSDAGIEDERNDSQEEVNVEEGGDLFATCAWLLVSFVIVPAQASWRIIPTAVNLERTWNIMMTVMIRARMCMKSFAAWKMSVFAISIVRA